MGIGAALGYADTFARWHVESGDVDPVYPVMEHLIGPTLDLDWDERISFVLLYVAYYDIASALRAWTEGWRIDGDLTDEQLRYRTGTERRAHRDVRQFRRHIESMQAMVSHFGGPDEFLSLPDDDPRMRWRVFQDRLSLIHGNGRWAGYKTGEILDTVLGHNCPPPDAGHAYSSGPRKGLVDLVPASARWTGNDPATIRQLDQLTNWLVDRWKIPVAQVETVLCDWHSTVNGHYYVGHDIDLMQEQVSRVSADVRNLIMEARAAVFDHRWLGEFGGWDGVRKPLNRLFVDRFTVEWW
ncbi:MAG TPA: hypothetical protein VLI04_13700 [Nocardioidaceae bacterium]|nr:hypothetical protein [Nocardioidaceae bacterium]